MATYNRNGAIEYARTWWNGHNPAYPDYDNDGSSSTSDCANFVSQCMYEGGGLPMKFTANTSGGYDIWYYNGPGSRSASWTGAQSLRLFVKYNTVGYPRMGYTFLSNSQVNQLMPGDIVFALNNDGSNKSNRTAKHVALVSRVSNGNIYVYAHSSAKNDQLWGSALNDTILCHFDGTILTNGSSGGSNGSSTWQERYGTTTLRPSNTYSLYVQNLQTDLIALGYSCGTAGADGYFGTNTTTAVRAFQETYNLTVDGLVGNATKQALFNALYS